ncbi:AMED_5909 family protein [Prauserella marina]|nr:AMED_5909 family protein [Prauserella marina]
MGRSNGGESLSQKGWRLAKQARTLRQAHEALGALVPSEGASSAARQEFYRRSAAVYAAVAETDRGHHHEALYWAERERRKAEELTQR